MDVRVVKKMRTVLICVLLALLLALLLTRFVAHHTTVEGSSMEPALADGDQLIVEQLRYALHDPRRYDIVVFEDETGIRYVKRIIGMPGETVQILDGSIYIDGERLIEEYGDAAIEDPGLAATAVTLAADEYFVLGDHRNASVDSRSDTIGNVRREQIQGQVWLRFYPFSQMGFVY